MRYAFIAEHRDRFGVRAMCRCLAVQPSGFYAWQKSPLSQRAREDARQTDLIRKAWNDSGKVYGYRKLHDDLLDHGETCCPNRVARLTRLAGIRPRSATSAGLAATVASRPWRSTTRWIASSTWLRQTEPG
ncbi:HTH-like domain-containing protein [Novosphingobium panipatense]|uniref:HTH-like domain-containing protein n=1 Tax=Novosphingobium panipatense TaxID=428991 RepID=A0ABY1QYQ4_9SPHN|nr:HTH-like domain-containing protein [Novosphingobium panipatense]